MQFNIQTIITSLKPLEPKKILNTEHLGAEDSSVVEHEWGPVFP